MAINLKRELPPNPGNASEVSIADLVKSKSLELFAICDKEGKGYINKTDMQRLHGELALDDEQLGEVFDRLDCDGNGTLTFEEFSDGFGNFLCMNVNFEAQDEFEVVNPVREDLNRGTSTEQTRSNNSNIIEILNQLQLSPALRLEREPLDLLNKIAGEDANSSVSVEEFLERVVHELNETKKEKQAIEKTLRERSAIHENQVKQLFEEMELQIKAERQSVIREEVLRERSLSFELQNKLKQREEHLKDVLTQQESLEKQVARLSSGKLQVKTENAQLLQLNESLAEELQETRMDLEDTRIHMEVIKQKIEDEDERKRAEDEARKLDIEKKSLITQLGVLREVNRKLRDDKDEVIEQSKKLSGLTARHTSTPKQKYPLCTQGSNVGKYFPEKRLQCEALSDTPVLMEQVERAYNSCEDATHDSDSYEQFSEIRQSNNKLSGRRQKNYDSLQSTSAADLDDEKLRDGSAIDNHAIASESLARTATSSFVSVDEKERIARNRFYRKLSQGPDGCSSEDSNRSETRGSDSGKRSRNRIEIDGKSVRSGQSKVGLGERYGIYSPPQSPPPAPDRVYKVVFVGNSGVGKTSFIQQFVTKTFRSSISSTIGVDYQMKTVKVDGQSVALQLWDTAGQERYRSITRQYFRKADGIVVMYDVTNEKSFLAVRNWMQSVQEGADPNAVILLIGNKNDIASETERQVTPKEGAKLAEEYGASFSEASAKSGKNIFGSMLSFANELTRLEDEQRESVLSLAASEEETGKMTSKCCIGKNN